MKKLLVIKGSSRKNGITNTFIDRMSQLLTDTQCVFFDSFARDFHSCIGCDKCKTLEKCVFSDLDDFFEDFTSADVIVFASPVYNGFFTAPVKGLLDRLQLYFNLFYKYEKKQYIEKKRKIILLGASGRDGAEEFAYMERLLKRAFTVLNGEMYGSVLCKNTDTETDFENEFSEFMLLLKRSLKDEEEKN